MSKLIGKLNVIFVNKDIDFKWIIVLIGGLFELLFSFILIYFGTIPQGPWGVNLVTISMLLVGLLFLVFAFLIKKGIIKNNYKNVIFLISLIICIIGIISILIFLSMVLSILPYMVN
jgi:hypothetical protein